MRFWGHIFKHERDNKFSQKVYYVCIGCNRRHRKASGDLSIVYGAIGICPHCTSNLFLTPAGGTFDGGDYLSYLFSATFYQGMIQEAIHRYKFRGMCLYSTLFSHLILENLEPIDLSGFDAVTAVPLSKQRLHERGFNQSALLAEPIARAYHLDFLPQLLVRTRDTRPQSSLDAPLRRTNVQNAFQATGVSGKRILLVDDIFTTGHTMDSCSHALLDAGAAHVAGITLSKVDTKRDRLSD